jgi:two-component system LytT family response regulator
MKVLIIDDEKLARVLLKSFLAEIENIEIIGEAENGFEGLKLIGQLKPELIFLDVQMPKLNGFEMLELIAKEERPLVIFSTAYDEFALKAFEENAIDYLLKPYSSERLAAAIHKAKDKPAPKSIPEQNIIHKETKNRIIIKDGAEIIIIPMEDVLYLEAQDDYVEIHTAQKKYLKLQSMRYFEEALDPNQFVRIHRKYILKVTELKKLEKFGKETYVAILQNNETLSVSATGYQNLKAILGM